MKKSEQAKLALLGLVLLLAGLAAVSAFRMLRDQRRMENIEVSRRILEMQRDARRAARVDAGASTGTDVLEAPEVTTVSGREVHMEVPGVWANSIPVLLAYPVPPRQR
jgi:hypothetical protein